MEKEKSVILDEIASYEDQPEEAINDDFEGMLFDGHSLGENILGTIDSVKSFQQKHLLSFINKNYNTHEIILAVSGNYSSAKVLKLAEQYFGIIPENKNEKRRGAPLAKAKEEKVVLKPINQAHCLLGIKAYSFHEEEKTGLLLLNNILGGTGMSSRLNLEIREKHGIAYTIESNYSPLSDTGLFTIYFGTDSEKVEKALKLTYKELKKLREQKLGTGQLAQAKKKFIGQIALGEENRMGVLISMAKSLLDYNRIDSLKEVFARINQVKSEDLLTISNQIFAPEKLSMLLFKPED
jgi:predicted Zn-dependent peptidase